MKPFVFRNLYVAAVVTVGLLVAWTAAAPGGVQVIQQRGLIGGLDSCSYSVCDWGPVPCEEIDSNCTGYALQIGTVSTVGTLYYRIRDYADNPCTGINGHDCSGIHDNWCDSYCTPGPGWGGK